MSLLTNLLVAYTCEEASGNLIDVHTNGVDLTATNSPGTATGKVGNGRDLESGSSQQFSSTNSIFDLTGNQSYSLWYKPESLSATQSLIGKNTNSGNQRSTLLFYDATANRPTWRVSSDGSATVAAVWGSDLSVGTWYHIVVKVDVDNNIIGIKINDGTWVTNTYNTNVFSSTASFRVGASIALSLGNFTDGVVDEIYAWDKVLTDAECTRLYNSGNGLGYANFGDSTRQLGLLGIGI